jgi:KDO2-lipid IV(A) lauroyltransferase
MKLKHRIESGIVGGGLRLGNLLPWSWISAWGAGVGRFLFHIVRARRRVAMENLDLALGETRSPAELRRIAGRCYAQFGRSYAEFFGLAAWHRRREAERFEFEGTEHLEAARARGKGVLCLTAHFGNPEILALALQKLGVPLHILVGDLSNPAVDAAMNDLRQANGFPIEHRGMGLRGVVKALRQNKGIIIQGDQEARWHGIVVPFFGRASLTHPGTARLSLKTGAAILPCFHLREGGRHRILFDAPLYPDAELSDESVLALTEAHTGRVEAVIRRYPDHWFWLHKRWKRAPRGADGLPKAMAAGAGEAHGGA